LPIKLMKETLEYIFYTIIVIFHKVV
jgi:hypothetical protein